jgi:hypothetical protein
MSPDGAIRLLDLYARAQQALDHDEIDAAESLIMSAGALLAEATPPDADHRLLRALAVQAEEARIAAVNAMDAARTRLLRAAQLELRPGGGAADAYAGSHERPGARFIDRTS